MKKLLLIALVLLGSNAVKAQYAQTFENVNLAQLIADSGWSASGVSIGNSNKLSGAKELITQLLNTSTSSSTYLTTYYYNGKGTNTLQFEHVINNASGKDIDLVVNALDSVNVVISTFTFTYQNASKQVSTWSFTKNGRYKLSFAWSGAKVSSGSTAGLDMIVVSSPVVPLPVNLINFKAEMLSNAAQLNWATASESNTAKFEVYRSTDGKNFMPIGTVNAIGNSHEMNQYAYYDATAQAVSKGTLYYKIKAVDFDNQSSWSNVIKVSTGSASISTAGVYPNPAVSTLNVNFGDAIAADATITITDAFGKTIASDITINSSSATVDVRNFESGIYFINIKNTDGTTNAIKFIKS